MKLIFCPKCTDVVRLLDFKRRCFCGSSWGQYTDYVNAIIGGEAIPIGFSNPHFTQALKDRPEEGNGSEFKAFVIPVRCPTIKWK